MNRLMRIFVRPTAWSVGGQGLGAVLRFAGFAWAARLLPVESFGAWVVYLTVLGLAESVRAGLVEPAAVRRSAAGEPAWGSAWALAMVATLGLGLIGASIGYGLFGVPVVMAGLVRLMGGLPLHAACWAESAGRRFGRVAGLRMSVSVLVLAGMAVWQPAHWATLVWIDAGAHVLVSAGAVWTGWSRLREIVHARWSEVRTLGQFGRFSVGTLLGSSALKSTDAFVLSAWLGPVAVAAYAIPQRMMEAAEVIVRGVSAAAYPRLAARAAAGEREATRRLALVSAAGCALALLPMSLVWGLWAGPLVWWVGEGGAVSATVLQVFAVYALLLPFDRFLGVLLDAEGRPQLNALKVGLMAGVNLAGDLTVLALGGGVVGVAFVTIGMTLVGLAVGACWVGWPALLSRLRQPLGAVSFNGWRA